MKTKYKLGERVLFTNQDGLEELATITGITTSIRSDGTTTIYASNEVPFEESMIVGRVYIQRPRTRAKKKLGCANIQDSMNAANTNGAA